MANDDPRQAQTLDIPHGTTFEFKDGKLVFGHDTDIVIRTNLGGHKFQRIFSKRGSVQVMPPAGVEFDVDEIEAAAGDVFLNGRVRVRNVRAKTIHFQEGALVAERLEATAEVVLSGQKIDVVHVKAPRVAVDGEAQGTCLVIESGSDPGKLRVRGGFRSMEEAREAFERFEHAGAPGGKAQATGQPARGPAQPSSEHFNTAALPTTTPPAPMSRPGMHVSGAPVPRTEPGHHSPLVRDRASERTEEFRLPTAPPEDEGPLLPKSSVFRKRK